MYKILLISSYVYHYRISNYNYFYRRFGDEGIEFRVLANGAQEVDFDMQVPICIKKHNIFSYIRFIRENKPNCVILFLHLKDLIIFPIVFYCKISKIPIVYWAFGIDLFNPKSKLKNILYNVLHWLSNAILLYSPNEMAVISQRYHKKTFIANNTINLIDFENVIFSGNYLKDHYKIRERYIILFVGNNTTEKNADELLHCFREYKDISVVFVGNAITKDMLQIINNTSNYYYLGEIYNRTQMAKIFHSADIVCIPGNVGLAIIDSFFWGKPVVTVKPPGRMNSPEIWYLKNGENGFIARDVEDMKIKIIDLLSDSKLYIKFSDKAKEISMGVAHISKMYEGFKNSITYLYGQ